MEYRSGRMTPKYRRWGKLARIALVAVAVGQRDHRLASARRPDRYFVNVSVSVTPPQCASLSPTLVLLVLLCESRAPASVWIQRSDRTRSLLDAQHTVN